MSGKTPFKFTLSVRGFRFLLGSLSLIGIVSFNIYLLRPGVNFDIVVRVSVSVAYQPCLAKLESAVSLSLTATPVTLVKLRFVECQIRQGRPRPRPLTYTAARRPLGHLLD